jgi:hypothetical protein
MTESVRQNKTRSISIDGFSPLTVRHVHLSCSLHRTGSHCCLDDRLPFTSSTLDVYRVHNVEEYCQMMK